MTETAAPPSVDKVNGGPQGGRETPTAQAGSPLFAELVWAHHRYERKRHKQRNHDSEVDALEEAYLRRLREFQDNVGELEQVYWSTKRASAVGMTVKHDTDGRSGHRHRLPTLLEHDERVQLHRVSDWVTGDAPRVADLLHECDLLAIRAAEVLRGTPERIAMSWLLGVQAHLLGFIERTKRLPDDAAEKNLVRAQRAELAAIERYYHRAASKAGRLVYVTGMLIGVVPVLLLGLVLGVLLWQVGLWDREAELLLICMGAGTIGALVSAISRMGKPEKGKFNIDFELGRPLIRRLGAYRPFLGAIVGVALYFLLASGIVEIVLSSEEKLYYYGFAAFLVGFSERFANVMFGAAERRLSGGQEIEKAEDED